MAAITDIPVPPAIIAPAKLASASSSSPDARDSDFASELAAAQSEQQSSHEDASGKDDLPVGEDAPAKNTAAALPVQVAQNEWQPNAPLSEDIVTSAAQTEETPQAQAAQPAPVAQQAELAATAPVAAANPVEDTDIEGKPSEEKKADEADATALPAAAPVADVAQAMLPTPSHPFGAQFGEAPALQNKDTAKVEPTPDLRASVNEAAPAAKPAANESQPAKTEGEQPATPAQPGKVEAKADGQQHQNNDRHDKPADAQPIQKTDAQTDEHAVVASDIKPAAPQPQAAQNTNTSTPSGPQLAAASGISQPHSAQHVTGPTAVNFTPSHQPLPAPDQIAFAISSHSKDGMQNFEIRLDPAELGRVDVTMTVDDAGNTKATLVVERPHTLELLKADSHNLEKALKESGLNLTQDGLNFSLKGQERQAQQEQNAPFVRAKILNMELTAAETAQAHINSMLPPGSTRLDIRV